MSNRGGVRILNKRLLLEELVKGGYKQQTIYYSLNRLLIWEYEAENYRMQRLL